MPERAVELVEVALTADGTWQGTIYGPGSNVLYTVCDDDFGEVAKSVIEFANHLLRSP